MNTRSDEIDYGIMRQHEAMRGLGFTPAERLEKLETITDALEHLHHAVEDVISAAIGKKLMEWVKGELNRTERVL